VVNNSANATAVVRGGAGSSHLVAALLSAILPEAGQVSKGQPVNGLVWFVAMIFLYVAFIPAGLLLHMVCIVGAASGS